MTSHVYTKIESDELLEAKANAADVHTKDEINGLYTYDRKVCKVDAAMMKNVAERINEEVGRILV